MSEIRIDKMSEIAVAGAKIVSLVNEAKEKLGELEDADSDDAKRLRKDLEGILDNIKREAKIIGLHV